ncbi:MAG: hypothetical protein U1E45_19400 [Geminicoccaceae bacterium]
MRTHHLKLWAAVLPLAVLLVAADAAWAQVTISQTKAVNGAVTPGDAAGFPVTLTQPGSYRLTSNLQVPSGKDGIVVTGTEVTIDLNGFRVDGGGVGRDGIVGQQRNLTVRNGTVRKFARYGINNNGAALLVDSVRVQENAGTGVYDAGAASAYGEVRGSSILGNGDNGVYCRRTCVVRDSNVSQNRTVGILLGAPGGLAVGNAVVANGENGVVADGNAAIGGNLVTDNPVDNVSGVVSQGTNVCARSRC